MPVTVQTATPVDRSVDRLFKFKSRYRLTVDPKIQRANDLQSGNYRSTARSTEKRAHGYVHLPEPRSTQAVDRLNLS